VLVSYTLPCHKREADLLACLPSVITAALASPPVEIVVVDYGCVPHLTAYQDSLWPDGLLRVVRVEAEHFHMAHARNVGIRQATGDVVVAFLADQVLQPSFFADVRALTKAGTYLKWHETFVFNRQEILDAGGFDERFELYGPEGKELHDRLQRRGLHAHRLGSVVSQLRTSEVDKVRNYRLKASKHEMHHVGMAYWRDNQERGVTVANAGAEWGAVQVPVLA
jgi:hypothetical protein